MKGGKWVDWISANGKKNVGTSKMYILRKTPHFMTTFHNFALKILDTRNVNNVCEYVWLDFLKLSNYLENQMSILLEVQMCAIYHKPCRGSSNVVFMSLRDTCTHITESFWRRVCPNILKQINHFAWIYEVCCLNHFPCKNVNQFRLLDILCLIFGCPTINFRR